ncbi:MAG TPA: hypothetical protein VFB38_25545 [Chthonomonadaceae bacterium]|nr:hypothetical protein [Chthonomonadaceae bacterium]
MARRFTLMFAVAVALSAAPAARIFAQQAYTLTDVAAWVSGSHFSNSTIGINASGQVAGTTTDATGASRAFRWTPSSPNAASGALALLALPKGATGSDARAINSFGQVAGAAFNASKINAERWEADGTITALTSNADGFAINDAGEVAGRATGSGGSVRYPFLWVNGTTYNLSSQGAGWIVTGMNAIGQVLGWAQTNNNYSYIWTPTKPNGTSGASLQIPIQGNEIDDSAQVAAESTQSPDPLLYNAATGVTTDLGMIASFNSGAPLVLTMSDRWLGM